MKKFLLFAAVCIIPTIHCGGNEEPLFCHVTGWVLNEDDPDSTGVDNIIVKVNDIDPEDVTQLRQRQTTTRSEDSLPGYFEMDSVCYGTSKQQGTGYITFIVDSLDNPGWETRLWHPDIYGEEDTETLYVSH